MSLPVPIFIVGMPRTGTTLLDRILGNHSQVRSLGERNDFVGGGERGVGPLLPVCAARG